MAEEDAQGAGSVEVGRRLDLPGRDGRGWTVAGVDPKSGEVILTRPQGDTVVTLTISHELYESLKTVGPNARYRKPSLRFRLGNVFTAGDTSARVSAYDDVGKRALVETSEGGQVVRRWVAASALDRLSTGQNRLEDVLQEVTVPQEPEVKEARETGPVRPVGAPLPVTVEATTPPEVSVQARPTITPDEEAAIEEATEDILEERETPKAVREELRSKRTEERITALKQDPEADLFVRLVAAGAAVPDPAFRQKLSTVPGDLSPEVLSQVATEYVQEQASRGVEDWRTVTQQAVRTVADRPANDPVYQALVVKGTAGTREERLKSFVINYPEKAKAYAFTDQEMAVTLQAVGREGSVASPGAIEVELQATVSGGQVGADVLLERRTALVDEARKVLSGYGRLTAGYRSKLEGVRNEIKTLSQKTQGINAALTPSASMEQVRQYETEITKADGQRRKLQDEQVRLTVQSQGVNTDAERLSRALRQFERATPTEEGLRAFETQLGQVPVSVKQAVTREARPNVVTKQTVRAGSVPAARRIGARRSVGRSSLAAGVFAAATSLLGAQQSSRLSEQGIGGDQDAYSAAFGSGRSSRQVTDSPGQTYTRESEDVEQSDRLPTAGEESQRIRAKERTMRETLAFHAGEGEQEYGMTEGQELNGFPGPGRELSPFEDGTPEEEADLEMDRASQLLNAQQQARGAQEAAQAAGSSEEDAGDLPGQLGGIQRLSRLYNMTKYSSAATGVGIFYTLVLMNVSLVAKLINAKSVPKQSFIEDGATIFLDIAIVGTSLLMLVPLMLGLAALIGLGIGVDAGVSALLDLFR